ncbi:MAG: nucleotide sugar dehydrogenase, partial [Polyangiales bacterium]
GRLRIVEDINEARDVDFFVVTVGTPLLPHIETDLSAVTRVIAQIGRIIVPGQCIIMRSTTAPHTTRYVRTQLERESGLKVGEDLLLACCPERILEGKAREELRALPQVVGTEDERSAARASELFGVMGVRVLHTDYITAELVKLSNNIARYAYFATANVLAMVAMEYGAEPHTVFELANTDYPRPIFGSPGFTAGTCLRKDFGMLSEAYWSGDILIESWRINESMPKFLIDQTKKRWGSLEDERVLVLGYSFKRDTDDVRDSLSAKLLRYLQRECPKSLVTQDPHVSEKDISELRGLSFTPSLDEALQSPTLIYIATNHSLYTEQRARILSLAESGRAKIVDLWDALGTGTVFIGKNA